MRLRAHATVNTFPKLSALRDTGGLFLFFSRLRKVCKLSCLTWNVIHLLQITVVERIACKYSICTVSGHLMCFLNAVQHVVTSDATFNQQRLSGLCNRSKAGYVIIYRPNVCGATLSDNSLRQTVQTHRASVHQAAKLVAALLTTKCCILKYRYV